MTNATGDSPFLHILPRMWTVVYVTVTATLGAAWLAAACYTQFREGRGLWIGPDYHIVRMSYISGTVALVGWPFALVGLGVILQGSRVSVSLTFCSCVALLIILSAAAGILANFQFVR